jgi:hypothetical protein
VTDNRGNHLTGSASAAASRTPQRPRDGGGGKGLVTKAVNHLVHFPAIADRVSGAQLTQLEINEDAGSRFLFELIDQIQQEPAASTAVLLERWRERPEAARMRALAGEEGGGIDEGGAALELISVLETLAMEPRLRRHEELLAKAELNEDERSELKELTVAIHRAKSKVA